VIALLVCLAIVAPFAGLFFRLGQWWERTRQDSEFVLPRAVVARHPSCERRHVRRLHVVPDLPANVVPIFDFEEPTPA
jgi:hypothetical protein